jgi:hypothetical protein
VSKRYAVHLCGGDWTTPGSYFAMAEFLLHIETHRCGRRGKPFCDRAEMLRAFWLGPRRRRRRTPATPFDVGRP